MKYLIIGTAGHVDHGKSALIKALTGVDTDRFKEEKQRGISIDLGFASLQLTENIMAGIVDVPGHERFLKNMLAGTGGIDLVLFVVAADEGVMPQTREHLAMLNLYGVRNGIVVVNKVDKVDADWLELVEDDIKGILKGTFLEDAPFCKVSAVTGEGLEAFGNVLRDMAEHSTARDFEAPFRLWIDRVFIVKGHGIVVTGSALSGTVKVGETLSLYPLDRQVRIRGLEWHGEKAEMIAAGQRAAINLAGIDYEDISRGMVLSSAVRGESSSIWDVSIKWLEEVATNTRVRLHIGTGEFLGRIHLYKNKPSQYCRLVLEQQLSAGAGDRGILRLYSPQQLLGGVLLIAPTQKGHSLGDLRIEMAKTLVDNDSKGLVQLLLTETGKPLTIEEITRRAGYINNSKLIASLKNLVKEKKVRCFGALYICEEALQTLTKQLKQMLQKYHQLEPERQGLPREIIRQRLNLGEKGFESLYEYWQQEGWIIVYGAEIALAEHKVNHSSWQQEVTNKAEKILLDIELNTVDLGIIEKSFTISTDNARKIHDVLVKSGVLIRVGDLYLTKMIIGDVLLKLQQHFKQQPTITVAEMRDMFNTSRKIAMPLLEYCDGQKYTIREGDQRRAGAKLITKDI